MKIPNPISCTSFRPPRPVRGVALLIALLLLVVLTILGVASMSNVAMQERMAGNVNLQTLAFEAASAGVSDSLVFGLDKDNWAGDCTRGSARWITDWTAFKPIGGNTVPGVEAAFRQRIGCFEPDEIPDEWTDPDVDFDVPVQLLVLNQGVARRFENGIAGEVLAMRDIEVRIENRGGDPFCTIQVQGEVDHSMPTSGAFSIDGAEGGCPLQTEHCPDADNMIDEIGDKKIGNYTPNPPGIDCGRGGSSPWNDPRDLASFANRIKWSIRHIDDGYHTDGFPIVDDSPVLYPGMEETFVGPDDLGICSLPLNARLITGNQRVQGGGNVCGAASGGFEDLPVSEIRDGITYIAGDLRMGGNPSGQGIIIVEGDICWNGRAEFEGMIIGLGGHFEMDGGGTGVTEGNLLLANISEQLSDSPSDNLNRYYGYDPDDSVVDFVDFGPSVLDFSGGGKHSFESSCQNLAQNIELLNSCLAEPIPETECGPDGFADRNAIASWREYIDGQRWNED